MKKAPKRLSRKRPLTYVGLLSITAAMLGLLLRTQAVGLFPPPPRATGLSTHYANHTERQSVRSSAVSSTFAMLKTDAQTPLGQASVSLTAGSVYAVVDSNSTNTDLFVDNQTVTVPSSAIWKLTVTPGQATPILKIGGKVVLGFDDANTSQYLQHLNDSISILSPLSFSITDASGTLTGSVPDTLTAQAKARGIQIWPIVEAGFQPARSTALLSSPAAKWHLLTEIVQLTQSEHLNGINLDFEDLIASDAPRLTQLTTDLATVLHAMGKGISVDVTPPSNDPNWGTVYDRAALAKAADYEIVMTYDEHYEGDPNPGSTSSLPWMEQGIANTLALGVPKDKLLVGIPFYTIDWTKSTAGWQSAFIGMDQAQRDTAVAGAASTWDAQNQQDILRFATGNTTHTLWMENSTSLNERGQFITADGLAGVGIWQLSLGSAADLTQVIGPFRPYA